MLREKVMMEAVMGMTLVWATSNSLTRKTMRTRLVAQKVASCG